MPTAFIVDDSAIVRMQLRQILARIGSTVTDEAATGDKDRAVYEEHRPDLITLDIAHGKDGVTAATDVLRVLVRDDVMCTSLTTPDKTLACQCARICHDILNPFDLVRAVQVVCFALARDQGAVLRSAQ